MKFRGPPLWLVCDVVCWLGVLISLISFTLAFAAAVFGMAAQKRRRLAPEDLASLARLQAEQEAWLRYAIARRAFRLAGLDVSRVSFPDHGPARTQRALGRRACQILRDNLNLDRIATRAAERLKRLLSARLPSATRTVPAASESNPQESFRSAPFARRRPGQRVRAPPWRRVVNPKQKTRALADSSARTRAFADQ